MSSGKEFLGFGHKWGGSQQQQQIQIQLQGGPQKRIPGPRTKSTSRTRTRRAQQRPTSTSREQIHVLERMIESPFIHLAVCVIPFSSRYTKIS